MKALLISLFVIASTASRCSTIDDLKSTSEVVLFLKSQSTEFQNDRLDLTIKPTEQLAEELTCDGIFKQWGIKNWEKTDLNNDGKTDLLVIAEWYGPQPMAVLDMGNENYKVVRLKRNSFQYCELFKPFEYQREVLIKGYIPNSSRESLIPGAEKFRIDTLTFFKNTLVKYNPAPTNRDIKSISLRTSACYGACPEFTFELTPDDMVQFHGIQHTSVIGKRTFSASNGTFKDLSELLNYMDVNTLESKYDVSWTDDQTAYLTVRFADGSTKKIQDYGMQGTPGLKTIYQKIMGIVKGMNSM